MTDEELHALELAFASILVDAAARSEVRPWERRCLAVMREAYTLDRLTDLDDVTRRICTNPATAIDFLAMVLPPIDLRPLSLAQQRTWLVELVERWAGVMRMHSLDPKEVAERFVESVAVTVTVESESFAKALRDHTTELVAVFKAPRRGRQLAIVRWLRTLGGDYAASKATIAKQQQRSR